MIIYVWLCQGDKLSFRRDIVIGKEDDTSLRNNQR